MLALVSSPAAASNSEQREGVWLKASTWTIVTVLVLLFCFTISVSVFGFGHPESHKGWQIRPYRGAITLLLTLTQLALVAAIAIRDHRRWHVEQLLRESQERMALAAGSADIGLWRWDADGDHFWATGHCRAIFAIPPGVDYALTTIRAAIHPDDLPLVDAAVMEAITSGAIFEVSFRLTLGDGRLRWVRCRARPEADADGKMIRMAGTILDVSERMTMQAEIDRQRQSLVHLTRVGAIGELSGALAHELNQPLTAILSNAQAIQRMIGHNPINMEELRGAIADIIADDSRAGDVIRHLRTLLKKEEAVRELVDMKALVEKVISLARNELVTRHIVPVIKLMEDVPQVLGDAVQLQQLLLNLILNAVEAIGGTGQGDGVVMITGDVVGEWRENRYHLSISDTGPGIRQEIMDKLFEPFFSTKRQGLGLGLSISHAIVESHGGSIRAESNSWGGATFHVFLPLARPGPP